MKDLTISPVLIERLSQKTHLSSDVVKAILNLLHEGSTIPFIARYRKEMTQNATDEQLRHFDEVYDYEKRLLSRKEEILRLIEERGFLTDSLKKEIHYAQTLHHIEDIYRPFKEKKNTRASIALTQGLEPFANFLLSSLATHEQVHNHALTFFNETLTESRHVIEGAKDILAERYSDTPQEREFWRNFFLTKGVFEIHPAKNFNPQGVYSKLINRQERISSIPSHRYLAMMRGAEEKELSIKIHYDLSMIESTIQRYHFPAQMSYAHTCVYDAYCDGFKRLLFPSLEREIHALIKERSDIQAVATFGKNLTQLLSTPPITQRYILGVDPGFKTGCKLAIIDETGMYKDHGVIYPTPPFNDYASSTETLKKLLQRYPIQSVAIGNGTASRETQEFFAYLNKNEGLKLEYTVVSEAGASIYSASKLAQEEYPTLDVTIRGAISIAQRLADPMAALVKIDPKSLGVGQYQHDVNQKYLEKKLHETTQDLVNRIGVDPNTASAILLSYVAGIGLKLAQAIVKHREIYGRFSAKDDLKKVKGLGAKAYEQCAGFLRIRESLSLLDKTGIHPESYPIAHALLTQYDIQHISSSELEKFGQSHHVGLPTLHDILHELKKPNFDPRNELPPIVFRSDVLSIDDLKEGSFISGIVRNLTDFGVFIDVGLKNDAFLHISQISTHRISHPLEVLTLNQHLSCIKVLEIDKERQKVSVSLLP